MRRAALALVSLLFAGCPRAPTVLPPERAGPTTKAEALAIVARRAADTETLRALFRVTVRRGETAETSRGALLLARPDRFRLQIFSFGVITVYDYTVNGDRFRVRSPLAGTMRTGQTRELADLDPALRRYDLAALFLGEEVGSGSTVREARDRFVIVSKNDGHERRIAVSKRTGAVVAETVRDGKGPVLRAEYRDARPVDGVPLPHEIAVEFPADGTRLEVEIQSYERNQPVDDELFRF